MVQSLSSDPYGNRAERYATGSENDANTVEMLKIDNASRQEQIKTLMLERTRQQLELQELPAPRKQLIERKLLEVEWWVQSRDYDGWRVEANQASALLYEQIRRQNINEAVEIFGRDVNRYNPYFIDYIKNFALYHPEVPMAIEPRKVVDCIFSRDWLKGHLHLKNSRGEDFRCAFCELTRLHYLVELTDHQQEDQRRAAEEIWFSRPFH